MLSNKVALSFDSVNEILIPSVTIQMEAIEQYFLEVLFIMLFKVALTDAECVKIN